MRFDHAIDACLVDLQAEGSVRSPNTLKRYRYVLNCHGIDVGNRDPAKTGKTDVKTTLGRWTGNSRRQAHSILNTFYKWTEYEGIRTTNPAMQVRPTRAVKPSVFRPTRDEVIRLLDASMGVRRERWIVHLGVLAGIRRAEFVGLQGRHFVRDGFVWLSEDIAKRNVERWVPVLPELVPVVAEIRLMVPEDRYVLGHIVTINPGVNTEQAERPHKPMHPTSIHKLVRRVGRKAGLAVDIGPHTLRHAFATHIVAHAGYRVGQALMGHASVATTEGYTEAPSLDELSVSVQGFSYRPAVTALVPGTQVR